MTKPEISTDSAQETAISALTYIAGDTAILARFLDVTGWTPATLGDPDARDAILVAALDYLMREEDVLLTFAANAGIEPTEISRAHKILNGDGTNPIWQ